MENQLAEIKTCLNHIPLLQPLSEQERAELASHLRIETYTQTTTLFEQGDAGDSFYIVKSGSVELIIQPNASTGEGKKLRKILKAGSSFGEMSLLTGAHRAGTAQVLADSELVVIEKSTFREVLLSHQSIAAELGATMLRLLASNQTAEQKAQSIETSEDAEKPPSVIIENTQDSLDILHSKIKRFFGLR